MCDIAKFGIYPIPNKYRTSIVDINMFYTEKKCVKINKKKMIHNP